MHSNPRLAPSALVIFTPCIQTLQLSSVHLLFPSRAQASATRAVCNGGIRLGLYDPIKTLMSKDGTGRDLHMGQKLAAGSISGCIGAVCTTPIELAKTRLQVSLHYI